MTSWIGLVLGCMIGNLMGQYIMACIGIRRRKSQHVSLKVWGKLTDVEREALKHSIDRLP